MGVFNPCPSLCRQRGLEILMKKMYAPERLRTLLQKIVTEILPQHGFSFREKQMELAEEIFGAMCRSDILLAEAGVGIGKTLAYLLAAVLIRRGRVNEIRLDTVLPDGQSMPVVIATSSIALQRAIVREYIPALSDILMEHGIIQTPLTAALRKGKGNYLCERKLEAFYKFADAETKARLAPLMFGALADLGAANHLTPYIKRNICVDDQCDGHCPLRGTCRYMRHLKMVRRGGYDFQVLNHNLFLADLLRRSKGQPPLIPDYQAVIVDEGHKFLDTARDMYGASLSLTGLCRLVKDVRGFTFAPGQPSADIIRECDRIYSKSRLLFQFLNKEVSASADSDGDAERFAATIRERTAKLIAALKENMDTLAAMLESRPVTAKFDARRRDTLRVMDRVRDSLTAFSHHQDLVSWIETGEGWAEETSWLTLLRGIPKNLGERLHKDLWDRSIPIILTSGTLSAAGSFEHIKKKTGLDIVPVKRLSETTKPSPFDYRENALLYISENTPFPENGNAAYIAAITEEVERLVQASRGHAVVLFTSHDALGRVYTMLEKHGLPYPLFRMGRGDLVPVERFKRSGDGVLLASGALWEGIDIPGDILSMLIIVRMPFAVPDPVSDWEKTLYVNMDEYKMKVIVPEMLVKLKQGFGRLIRTETDTGAIAILDSRANTNGAYRSRVLAALPPCRVTSVAGDIELFMRNKKSSAYFM
jgi:ATP-dependent DNA helicase DinG